MDLHRITGRALSVAAFLLLFTILAGAVSPASAQNAPTSEAVKSWNSKTTGSITANGDVLRIANNDPQTIYFSFSSIGGGGTVFTEASFDSGATWIAIPSVKFTSVTSGLATSWSLDTTNVFQADISPGTMFRLRIASYVSGTITVNANLRPFISPTQVITTANASPSNNQQVVGNVASGATDSGNPVKVGGVFNTTLPTLTNGQRGDLQLTNKAMPYAVISDVGGGGGGTVTVSASAADGAANGFGHLWAYSKNYIYNGSTFDFARGVANGTNSVGTGIAAAGLAGQCDDTTPQALTENSFGNVKIDCATHALEVGGTCNQQVAIAVTAGNTTQLVALSGSTVIRVCSMKINLSATGTYTLLSGTGSNCGTPANSTGVQTLAINTPDNWGDGTGVVWQGSAGGELCVTAATGNATGVIRYSQY